MSAVFNDAEGADEGIDSSWIPRERHEPQPLWLMP